jgi:hypothetical protein
MESTREPQYIHFHNDTDLPIMVDGWKREMDWLSKIVSIKIEPRQTKIVHSIVGEWYMHSVFENEEDRLMWKGFGKHHIIGKFRSSPCAMGDYSWMEYKEPFHCIYDKVEITDTNNVMGRITLKQTTKL